MNRTMVGGAARARPTRPASRSDRAGHGQPTSRSAAAGRGAARRAAATIRGAAARRRRRRPLAASRPRRHRHGRLVLRPVGDRRRRSPTRGRMTGARRSISCPGGPFAILPLKGNRVVAGVDGADATMAERLVAGDPLVFQVELERRFGHRLGAIEVVDTPRAFPLGLTLARDLRRAALRACRRRRARHPSDRRPGAQSRLPRRRGARRDDRRGAPPRPRHRLAGGARALRALAALRHAARWALVTDGLNRLFSNDNPALRLVRDVGLGLVDRMPATEAAVHRARRRARAATLPRLLARRGDLSRRVRFSLRAAAPRRAA